MYLCSVGINASMEVMHPVQEEPYEINLDNHGCQGGPKAGRLRALANVNTYIFASNFHAKAGLVFFSIKHAS